MSRTDPFVDPAPLIRRVYSYVAYRIGEGPEAEDVTSETFERAFRYRASYDSARGGPLAWLIGIARRCIDGRRLAPPRADAADAEQVAAAGDFEETAIDRLTVVAAVATLSDRDRELLALRYGADLTARQIGEILGLKTNAVDVALHRALARVRCLLESEVASEEVGPAVGEPASGTSV